MDGAEIEPNEKLGEPRPAGLRGRLLHFFKIFGPGVITGAADDDPSGIATYAQTGAQFGYGLLWTSLYQIPLMIAVQEACARIGAVTGQGLTGVIKRRYPKAVVVFVVLVLVVANTINIGADIGAVAEASRLVLPLPFWLYAIATALLVVISAVFIGYRTYSNVLRWLALALAAYIATALLTAEPWPQILYATFVPHFELSFGFLFILTGVFGTSISPYMFFWQASEEVEEEDAQQVPRTRTGRPRLSRAYIRDMRLDTGVGMFAAEAAQWFIIITTATVLFSHGQKNINTAADAAKALEPLVKSFPNAGQVARDLFAVGIIGLGLLGIPVLAGSAAYALAEAMGWREGLSRKFREARGFYGVIIVSTAIGLMLNFIGIDPFKALVVSAVINGVAAAPLLFVIARLNGDKRVLGESTGGAWSRVGVWTTFAVMAVMAVLLLVSLVWKPK